jgi:DNA-binding MurR/RpiR family transcriptional regulator
VTEDLIAAYRKEANEDADEIARLRAIVEELTSALSEAIQFLDQATEPAAFHHCVAALAKAKGGDREGHR